MKVEPQAPAVPRQLAGDRSDVVSVAELADFTGARAMTTAAGSREPWRSDGKASTPYRRKDSNTGTQSLAWTAADIVP